MHPRSTAARSVTRCPAPTTASSTPTATTWPRACEGEVLVRGYSVMLGLYKRERTEVFDADGWYHTGDRGLFRDGWFFFTGRQTDLIKTKGSNVAPAEVERVLMGDPGVKQAFVFGVDHPERGQDVVALVVPDAAVETRSTDQIAERLREHLSSYKLPRHIFPVDAVGGSVPHQPEARPAGARPHGRRLDPSGSTVTEAAAPKGPARDRGGKPAQGRQLRSAGKKNVAKLLDAALVVFAERGYHAARVDDVCDEADVSHGTFYLYFASKEDLFRTLVDDVVTEMRDLAGELPAIDAGAAGRRALHDWLGRFHDLYARYLPIIQAWNEANSADEELARLGARVLRGFIDRLVERMEENDPAASGDPRLAAMAMVSMVERSVTFALAGLIRTNRDALLDTLAGILHVGAFGGRRVTSG